METARSGVNDETSKKRDLGANDPSYNWAVIDVDRGVTDWIAAHYPIAEGFAEHKRHRPVGEPFNIRFGVVHSGYCNTCAESAALIAFDAICTCGVSTVFAIEIYSWSELYEGIGKEISRHAYNEIWEDRGFEAHDSGYADLPTVETVLGVFS